MRAFIYARVSTDKQSHDSQLHELREYCARRGWQNVAEIADTVSGTNTARQGLDKLMTLVRRGKVDAIVCYKLDRLGRSLGHLAQLIGEFDAHGVALIAPGQGIDTSSSNPAGRLQMHVLMAVAEFEREIIRERVNAGLAAARAKGVRFGRPNKLERHRTEVARLTSEGMSGRTIAAHLGLPAGSVFKLLAEINRTGSDKVAMAGNPG